MHWHLNPLGVLHNSLNYYYGACRFPKTMGDWFSFSSLIKMLTHWGRVTHICVGSLTVMGSENGLLPGRRRAIIWTNAGISSIGTLGKNFSENLSEIRTFSFKKMNFEMSGNWGPFCLGVNVLTGDDIDDSPRATLLSILVASYQCICSKTPPRKCKLPHLVKCICIRYLTGTVYVI